MLEFSGACPGCGESPYAKLVTQLFGSRMFIANATGCSSIWGCSAPSTPYTVDENGRGPAWANSLFEDNAEFGMGMLVSVNARRQELKTAASSLKGDLESLGQLWVQNMDDAELSEAYGKELAQKCQAAPADDEAARFIVNNADLLGKPSMWIFGGDGWAYDIGYGGLDHVLASGENVNVLVFDTEVYSNTGGQASKATQIGASGKMVKKKDLAQMAMAYGSVYVAQIAMGANPAQTLRALKEAEAYNGPSLIIAYAPCINHGVKAGMNNAMLEMQHAVRSGYWHLLRYNPDLAAQGKNPLAIDSLKPTEDYQKFLMGEVRYNSLKLKFPDKAEEAFKASEKAAMDRYETLINRKNSMEPRK